MSTNDLKLLIEKMSASSKIGFDKTEKRAKDEKSRIGIIEEKEETIINSNVGGKDVSFKSFQGDHLSRVANRRGALPELSHGGRLSKLFKGL